MEIAFCHGWLSTIHALFVGMKWPLMILITIGHTPHSNQTLLQFPPLLLTQETLNPGVVLGGLLVGSISGVHLHHMVHLKLLHLEL
jgi:hypothetical protein